MGSKHGAVGFGLGIAARAAVLGLLTFAAAWAGTSGRYATAAVVGLVFLFVLLDVIRSATAADRTLAQFVEGILAEGYERPVAQPGLARMAQAMEAALARLGVLRADRQRRIDHLEALTDNVAASLLVVSADDQVVSANRAARNTLGAEAGPLAAALPALDPEIVARLAGMAPGARGIVRARDGRAMLAQTALFMADAKAFRLISLQSLAGDLDAVELKAWQDLVRVLAHEMMNSLTPVVSVSESLAARLRAGDASPADVADGIEVIARRSARLMSFVERYRRLTDLPKAEKTRLTAVDLLQTLDELMGPSMAAAGVDYASAAEPRGLVLRADPDLIEQALINLLKNALEAAQGRPNAAVRLAARTEGGQAVLIVEDNGPGLPTDDPESAFVPFFTTKPAGSGVGLTLARQVALAHGGRLEHTAGPQGGAIFRLWLPLG